MKRVIEDLISVNVKISDSSKSCQKLGKAEN